MSFPSFTQVFQSRWADTFWAALDGRCGHPESYYAPLARSFVRSASDPFSRESSLCFDISNQFIQASVDVEGTIQEVRSAKAGLSAYHGPMRGVYVQKELVDGGTGGNPL